jgi:hypothetical protein
MTAGTFCACFHKSLPRKRALLAPTGCTLLPHSGRALGCRVSVERAGGPRLAGSAKRVRQHPQRPCLPGRRPATRSPTAEQSPAQPAGLSSRPTAPSSSTGYAGLRGPEACDAGSMDRSTELPHSLRSRQARITSDLAACRSPAGRAGCPVFGATKYPARRDEPGVPRPPRAGPCAQSVQRNTGGARDGHCCLMPPSEST